MITGKKLATIGFLIPTIVFAFVTLRQTKGQIHNGRENPKGFTAMARLDQSLMDGSARLFWLGAPLPTPYPMTQKFLSSPAMIMKPQMISLFFAWGCC